MASSESPEQWARSKRTKMERYARGTVLTELRRVAPALAPGVPVCAWLGVFANGDPNENTTGWIKGDATERAEAATARRTPIRLGSQVYDPNNTSLWSNNGFHELGVAGVEGGPATGLCPAPGSSWVTGATHADVRAALGRAAVTAPGAWKGAVPDQVALGIFNNRRHAMNCNANLPEEVRFAVENGRPRAWTQWVFAVSTMAWSAGAGGAARHLRPYAADLARVPETERFSAWSRMLVARGVAGRAGSHSNAFYSALRTWQKLRAGALAAEFTAEGSAPGWLGFVGSDGDAVMRGILAGATGAARGTGGGGGGGGGGGPSNPGPTQRAPSMWEHPLARRVMIGGGVVATVLMVGIGLREVALALTDSVDEQEVFR